MTKRAIVLAIVSSATTFGLVFSIYLCFTKESQRRSIAERWERAERTRIEALETIIRSESGADSADAARGMFRSRTADEQSELKSITSELQQGPKDYEYSGLGSEIEDDRTIAVIMGLIACVSAILLIAPKSTGAQSDNAQLSRI